METMKVLCVVLMCVAITVCQDDRDRKPGQQPANFTSDFPFVIPSRTVGNIDDRNQSTPEITPSRLRRQWSPPGQRPDWVPPGQRSKQSTPSSPNDVSTTTTTKSPIHNAGDQITGLKPVEPDQSGIKPDDQLNHTIPEINPRLRRQWSPPGQRQKIGSEPWSPPGHRQTDGSTTSTTTSTVQIPGDRLDGSKPVEPDQSGFVKPVDQLNLTTIDINQPRLRRQNGFPDQPAQIPFDQLKNGQRPDDRSTPSTTLSPGQNPSDLLNGSKSAEPDQSGLINLALQVPQSGGSNQQQPSTNSSQSSPDGNSPRFQKQKRDAPDDEAPVRAPIPPVVPSSRNPDEGPIIPPVVPSDRNPESINTWQPVRSPFQPDPIGRSNQSFPDRPQLDSPIPDRPDESPVRAPIPPVVPSDQNPDANNTLQAVPPVRSPFQESTGRFNASIPDRPELNNPAPSLPRFFKYRRQAPVDEVSKLAQIPIRPNDSLVNPEQKPNSSVDIPVQNDSPIDAKDDEKKASIVASKVLVVNAKGEDGGNKSAEAAEKLGSFVPTSGTRKQCEKHSDCYGMREPDEWCPLASQEQYLNKGCHCNNEINACIIERRGTESKLEYTDCIVEEKSKCFVSATPKSVGQSEAHEKKDQKPKDDQQEKRKQQSS